MAWTETDDIELQETLDRLYSKQKELQSQLIPLAIIINNSKSIQTKTLPNIGKEEYIKILPKDKWGDEMTDEYRLKIKKECIDKTIELLGEPDG